MTEQSTKNRISLNSVQKYFYALLGIVCVCKIANAAPATLSPIQQKVLSAPLQQPYQWFASTDPEHHNHDYLLLKPGEKRVIPLTEGALLRLWCTASVPDKISVTLQDVPLLANNKASIGTLHEKAFTLYPQSSPDATLRTLGKSAKLVAVNHSDQENKFFYQVSIRPTPIKSAPAYSGNKLLIGATKKLDTGESMKVGDAGQLQSGIINQIKISSPDGSSLPLQNLLLQIASGESKPIVQVPLSAFLGEFQQLTQGKTGLSSWDGKTLVIDWPMPADAQNELSFKIQNIGEAALTVKVDISFLQMDVPPQYLFFAHQGFGNSVENQPFTLAKITGAGALVGISASMGPTPDSPRRTFAFLEGNEIITADSHAYEGTGTEDLFNSSWYFPKETYLHPYDNMSAHSDLPPRVAASRWMIDDAIPFNRQLDISLEHGNGNRGSDLQYHWYVFWYQQQPVNFEIPKMLSAADANAQQPPSGAPENSWVAALLRVAIFTAFFAAFVFIVLLALARYGQRH